MKNKFIIPIATAALFMTGCNNYFDLNYPVNPAIVTVESLERATTGTYYMLAGLNRPGGVGGVPDNLVAYSSTVGDESVAVTGGGNFPDAINVYERNNANPNGILDYLYGPAYGTIGNANQWITEIEKGILDKAPDKEQVLIPHFIGEMKFLRAYCYFQLVRAFCPPYEKGKPNNMKKLPFVTTPTTGLSNAFPAPAEVDTIYRQIVKDLTDAKASLEMMPRGGSSALSSSNGTGRVGKIAASALLARVYFQMQEFALAEQECNFVITESANNGINLSQDPLEAWNKGWDASDAKELIWSFTQGQTPNGVNGLGNNSSEWNVLKRFLTISIANPSTGQMNPNNYRCMALSKKLMKQVGWMTADSMPSQAALNDKRFSQIYQFVDGNDPYISGIKGKHFWIRKYYRVDASLSPNNFLVGSVPLIRLSEFYLTRAIIQFNAGNKIGAAQDVDVVRQRAWGGLSPFVATDPQTLTEEDIHNERFKELAGEGDRLFYLQALKKNIPNGDRDGDSLPYNSEKLRFQLPQDEYDNNPNLDITVK